MYTVCLLLTVDSSAIINLQLFDSDPSCQNDDKAQQAYGEGKVIYHLKSRVFIMGKLSPWARRLTHLHLFIPYQWVVTWADRWWHQADEKGKVTINRFSVVGHGIFNTF